MDVADPARVPFDQPPGARLRQEVELPETLPFEAVASLEAVVARESGRCRNGGNVVRSCTGERRSGEEDGDRESEARRRAIHYGWYLQSRTIRVGP